MILQQARTYMRKGLKAPVLAGLEQFRPGHRMARAMGRVLLSVAVGLAGGAPAFAQESTDAPAVTAPARSSQGRVEVIWLAPKGDGAASQAADVAGTAGAFAVPVEAATATAVPGTGQGASGSADASEAQMAMHAQQPPASPSLLAAVPSPANKPAEDMAEAEPWEEEAVCPRDQVAPRAYSRCLFDATRASEQALEAALGRALAVISGRTDLAPAQRAAWRHLLEEAQYRFLIFRNFDCQSVAPFEGSRGIGNFEQRSLCLISMNRARADSLEQRYGNQPRAVAAKRPPLRSAVPQIADSASEERPAATSSSEPAVPAGPEPQLGAWTYGTQPVID